MRRDVWSMTTPQPNQEPIWKIVTPNDAAKSEGDYSVVLRRGQFELWVTCIERGDVIQLSAHICGLLNQSAKPQEPSEMKHSPEPYFSGFCFPDYHDQERKYSSFLRMWSKNKEVVATVYGLTSEQCKANADRIVTCVNFCAGVDFGMLPEGSLKDLIAVSQMMGSEVVKTESLHADLAKLREENERLKADLELKGKQILEMSTWPGSPLYDRYPYDLTEHKKQYGNGDNALRLEWCCQAGQLKVGDILITGEKVMSPPREGGNGSVLIHIGDQSHAVWIDIPSRIPIALKSELSAAKLAMRGIKLYVLTTTTDATSALVHILRMLIDAGVTEKLDELHAILKAIDGKEKT